MLCLRLCSSDRAYEASRYEDVGAWPSTILHKTNRTAVHTVLHALSFSPVARLEGGLQNNRKLSGRVYGTDMVGWFFGHRAARRHSRAFAACVSETLAHAFAHMVSLLGCLRFRLSEVRGGLWDVSQWKPFLPHRWRRSAEAVLRDSPLLQIGLPGDVES